MRVTHETKADRSGIFKCQVAFLELAAGVENNRRTTTSYARCMSAHDYDQVPLTARAIRQQS